MAAGTPATAGAASQRLFYFEGYDFAQDRLVRSRRPATRELIAALGYRLLEDNSVEVHASQIDADGLLAGDS